MSDDNQFNVEDILWEYADFGPPPEEIYGSQLPEEPQIPQDKPAMAAPQPVSHLPRPEPPAPRPARREGYLPANGPMPQPGEQTGTAAPRKESPFQTQDLADLEADRPTAPTTPPGQEKPAVPAPQPVQEKPAAPAAPPAQEKPAAPASPPVQEWPGAPATPPAQEKPAAPATAPTQEKPSEKGAEGAGGSAPAQGAAETPAEEDGPDLITFTPDPHARQQEAAASAEPAQQPGSVSKPPPGPQSGPQTAPGPAGGGAKASPRPDKKAPPPDAPPGQLAATYGTGLRALLVRCVGAGLLTLILLALALAESGLFPILDSVLPDNLLLPGSLALFLLTGYLCLDVLKSGLLRFLTLTPNEDTLALLATLFTLTDGVALAFFRWRTETLPFFAPCALVLTFHLISLYCDRSARFQSCRTAAAAPKPYVITPDPNVRAGRSAFRKWLSVPRGFGSQMRTPGKAERGSRKLTPWMMFLCPCLSLITTVAHGQPRLVFWSLSALFIAASTLGAGLCHTLPFRALTPRLSKLGAALAGWPAINGSRGCDAAQFYDLDLYPPGSVVVTAAQTFGEFSREEAVSLTASMIKLSGSGLYFLFDQLMRREKGRYRNLVGFDPQDGGMYARLPYKGGESRILVGNVDFMSRNAVPMPKGIQPKDAIFCARDMHMVGMFTLHYSLHGSIAPSLRTLFVHGIHPILFTRDFNLSLQRLRLANQLPMERIIFSPYSGEADKADKDLPHGSQLTAVVCREGIMPYTWALVSARRIDKASRAGSVFARLGAWAGVILTTTLSSSAALGAMCAWNLCLFLLLWLVPILLLALWTGRF